MSTPSKIFFDGLIKEETEATGALLALGDSKDVGYATEIEYNEKRSKVDVSGAVSGNGGENANKEDQYTTKKTQLINFNETFTVTAQDVVGYDPKKTVYEQPDFMMNLTEKMADEVKTLVNKVKRAAEVMNAKILQTGTLPIYDKVGSVLKTVNFFPKTTHFFNAGVAWDDSASVAIMQDIQTGASLIKKDGKSSAKNILFGVKSWMVFQANTPVQDLLNNRRYEEGVFSPELSESGASYQGTITIGAHQFRLWTYEVYYQFDGGAETLYIPDDQVIIFPDSTGIRTYFGEVPTFAGINEGFDFLNLNGLGSDQGMNFTTAIQPISPFEMKGFVATRMVAAPMNIDKIVRINTGV